MLHFVSTPRFQIYRKLSYSDGHIRVVTNSCITHFYLTTSEKQFRHSTSIPLKKAYGNTCIKSTVLHTFYDFLIPKKHRYYISNIWISVYLSVVTRKDDLPFQKQCNRKKNSTSIEVTRNQVVQAVPFVMPIEITMYASALVQQFMHLVHSNRSHRPSYLLRKIADRTGTIHTTIDSR